jgi:translation elongation factor EF-Tu-like GTPase
MNLCLIRLATLGATALLAAGCSKKADEPQGAAPVVFAAQAPITVNLTLLKADGDVGRSSAIANNYRPQLRFASTGAEVGCVVQLPQDFPALEPGQTSNATLVCDEAVSVQPGRGEFAMLEGGRQVGKGAVQLR